MKSSVHPRHRSVVTTLAVLLAFLLVLTVAATGCSAPKSPPPAASQSGLQQQTKPESKPSEEPKPAEKKMVTVGITQIAEHPALDNARKGFIDGLKEAGYTEGVNIKYVYKNAQGDPSVAATIAGQLVAQKVDLILAIATPAAQAAARATSDIPILITAVTDPVVAGLVKSMERPDTNVTGTTDMNPVKEQLELVKKFKPNAKNVGVLYNAGEPNSQVQVNMCKKNAPSLGLNIVEATVANTAEVKQAAQSLVGKVDAIYVPTDNTVVSALASVVQVAEQAKIPLIAGEGDSVKNGALATLGLDYYLLGKQTGEMAARVLKGAKPQEMPIETQKDMKLYLNLKAAKNMGVEIPDDLRKQADTVYE